MESLFNSGHAQIHQITPIYYSVPHLLDKTTKHFHSKGPYVYKKAQESVVMLLDLIGR